MLTRSMGMQILASRPDKILHMCNINFWNSIFSISSDTVIVHTLLLVTTNYMVLILFSWCALNQKFPISTTLWKSNSILSLNCNFTVKWLLTSYKFQMLCDCYMVGISWLN